MDYKEGMHNPWVRCPYNAAHEVPKLRLQRHLLKCRKQYADTDMKACPYNATHIMPSNELQIHFETCMDRNLIEGQKYNLNTAHGELGNPSFHPDVPKEEWGQVEDHHGAGLPNYQPSARPVQMQAVDVNDSQRGLRQPESHNKPLLSFGRGRIYQLVAEMQARQTH